MSPFENTPVEALDAPSLTPTPVTRRQLREQEAREALAAKATPTRRVPAPSRSPKAAAELPTVSTRASKDRARVRDAHPPRRHRPVASPMPVSVPVSARFAPAQPGAIASIRQRVLSKLASAGVLLGVGLIVVSTTVPANAFLRPADSSTSSAALTAQGSSSNVQGFAVSGVAAPAIARDSYTVVSVAQKLQVRTGGGILSYTNDPNGTIQWPFQSGVTITSGFGPRSVAGCGFCSKFHKGLDFTPGSGVPIRSMADGVVNTVIVSNAGLGNNVLVDHVINGQKIQTLYAHMQYGSIAVAEGQKITVGTIIGKVGNTGASTGAHLHFEVQLDGTPVDPYAWLKANAN